MVTPFFRLQTQQKYSIAMFLLETARYFSYIMLLPKLVNQDIFILRDHF